MRVVGGAVWVSVWNYCLLLYRNDNQQGLPGPIKPALGSRLAICYHHLPLCGRPAAHDWQLCTSHWVWCRFDARLCADAVCGGWCATQVFQADWSHCLSSAYCCPDGCSVRPVLRRTHLHMSWLPVLQLYSTHTHVLPKLRSPHPPRWGRILIVEWCSIADSVHTGYRGRL